MLQLLLYILLVRARQLLRASRSGLPMLFLEAAAAAWICYQYHGFMYVLFLSVLCSLFEMTDTAHRRSLAFFLLILMNAVLQHAGQETLFYANISFLTAGFLLFRTVRMEVGREELQRLYDELRKKHYELDEARMRIIEYAQKVENSAQAEERNRIAREIHDDLGHKLIRLKMMLEAVIHIMPGQPDKGMELVRQVRDQLTDSMETMRKTVRRLKPDEAEVHSYSMDRLIEDLSREPGFRVRYQVHGMPFPLYPSCEIVLYRNAQEAITNAIRHGQADEVQVDLTYGDHELVLSVTNNGTLPERLDKRGLGLSGMEERTRLLGGQLSLEIDNCFTVITRIPLIRT